MYGAPYCAVILYCGQEQEQTRRTSMQVCLVIMLLDVWLAARFGMSLTCTYVCTFGGEYLYYGEDGRRRENSRLPPADTSRLELINQASTLWSSSTELVCIMDGYRPLQGNGETAVANHAAYLLPANLNDTTKAICSGYNADLDRPWNARL
jgi:hypothetical protein